MARNFIILYTSREGSSAIVNALSTHPDIAVPLFEEFDEFWLKKFDLNVDIADEIDHVLATNQFRLDHDYGRQRFLGDAAGGDGSDAESIGFKWRWHGDMDRIAKVLKKHDVTLFLLFRRDLLELTCSQYYTRTLKKPDSEKNLGHVQFELAAMNEEDRAKRRAEIDQQTVPMNLLKFYMVMGWRVRHAIRNRWYAKSMERRGVPTQTIYYEDFLREPGRFFADFLTEIEMPDTPGFDPSSANTFVKTSNVPATERVEKLGWVRSNPLTMILQGVYNMATGGRTQRPMPAQTEARDVA